MNIENRPEKIKINPHAPTAGKVNFNASAIDNFLVGESFNTLRSNVLFSGVDIKKILITSSNEDEGKSTVAAGFSKSLSDIGKKTLMIDADMRKSINLRQGGKNQNIFGLSEYLSGHVGLEQIIYNTQDPNFDVIFCGHYSPTPSELLSSTKFSETLNAFAEVYDYIVIDAPPLGPVIDAAVISSNCDGVLFVISPGKTKYNEAISAKEQILASGCKILGAVINETDSKNSDRTNIYKKRYYYGDPSSKTKKK